MVVLTIIVVLTTVILTSQSSFNKTLILANTAYDIALTLRSTETFGLGSRAAGTATNVGYGIHLSSGATNSFILFADSYPGPSCGTPDCKPGDHVYTSTDVLVQMYQLNNGISIQNFCAFSSGSGGWSCAASGQLSSLDIVFTRPNPAPFMSTNGSYSAPPFSSTAACMSLASPSAPSGPYRYISVGSSGQIIANATSCP